MKFKCLFLVLLAFAWLVLALQDPKQTIPDLSKVELGQKLFFDPALSLDSSVSCASCHMPQYAFSDTLSFSRCVHGRFGLRNAPSIMNLNANELMFYDGRAKDLKDQVHFPIQDPNEMNLAMEVLVQRLLKDKRYKAYFQTVFHENPNAENLADAIAEFEKTLQTSNTPFDAFMSGDESAISESAKRGRDLFLSDKTKCFDCHFGPDFTGDEFRNIGLYDGIQWSDRGRFNVSKDSADLGRFKVPGLRNVGVTGPYMHNGAFKTLEQVIDYYSNLYAVVGKPVNLDTSLVKPLHLTKAEKQDLLSFLNALTDRQFLNR